MKLAFGKSIKKIFKKSTAASIKRLNSRNIHLPDDLIDPDGFLIPAGSSKSDVWPAVFMANTLQREFPKKNITIICSSGDNGIFNMLRLRPSVHSYAGNPEIPDLLLEGDSISDGTLLIYPYASVNTEMERILSSVSCRIRMAPLKQPSPYINFRIKTESIEYPDMISQTCSTLGIAYDDDWKPALPVKIEKLAETLMAPTSGRMLPYIVTTSSALSILEKSRAEIPLRTVLLSGKDSDFSNLDRDIKTAIIADATAVITDSDQLWGDACAFGVPVVGLDKSGSFIKWSGIKTAANETDFAEDWVKLLKKGW